MKAAEFEKFLNDFNVISTEVTDDVKNQFRHDPRQVIWYSAMAVLGLIYLKHSGEI